MPPLAGPLRTILDVPGHSDRKLKKALDSRADALMVDLEDCVPPNDEAKRAARRTIAQAVRGASKTVIIRVNEVPSPWFADDVQLAVQLGVAGIVVPKMRTVAELEQAAARLDALGAPASMGVWAIIESPAFLLAVERADKLPARLRAFIAGLVDFMFELTPRAFIHPLGLDAPGVVERKAHIRLRLLMAARAASCLAVDAITIPAITDVTLAAAEAARCRDAGFDATIVLHPAQIDPANAAFDLMPEERAMVTRILEAGRAAAAAAHTSALVDGRVVLPQHVKSATRYAASDDGKL